MKKQLIGSWLTINNLFIAEFMATFDFDWLCIDMEHSVIDYKSAQQMVLAIQSKGIKAYIRVGENNPRIIKRALDTGVEGLIIPNVNSLIEAKNALMYANYPPKGSRGVGLSRAQGYGFDFESYRDRKSKEIKLIVQIEHINAIKELDDIISIDGIDGTLIGPYDLSASMGKPGEWNDPDVKDALNRYLKISKKYDKLIGFHVIEPDNISVNNKIVDGYNFIAFSTDTMFLGTKIQDELRKIK